MESDVSSMKCVSRLRRLRRAGDVDLNDLEAAFGELEETARTEMRAESNGKRKVRLSRSLGLRYVGQGYEITTPISRHLTRRSFAVAISAFHKRHQALYRHAAPDDPMEVVSILVTAIVRLAPRQLLDEMPNGKAGPAPVHEVIRSVAQRD